MLMEEESNRGVKASVVYVTVRVLPAYPFQSESNIISLNNHSALVSLQGGGVEEHLHINHAPEFHVRLRCLKSVYDDSTPERQKPN